jgi:hypothetical protein
MLHTHQIHQIKKDGNCFFRAISTGLYGIGGKGDRHIRIRKHAIAYMESIPEQFAPFMTDPFVGNFPGYLDDMGRVSTWADHTAMQATADEFHLRIIVIRQNGDPTTTLEPSRNEHGVLRFGAPSTVHLAYDGRHYDYLIPTAGLNQPGHHQLTDVQAQIVADAQYALLIDW